MHTDTRRHTHTYLCIYLFLLRGLGRGNRVAKSCKVQEPITERELEITILFLENF